MNDATRWDHRGRPETGPPGGYRLIALQCWLRSLGAQAEGAAPILHEYARAATAAQPDDWLDAYFDERETCRYCGESYRFENISLCTACLATVCFRCKNRDGQAANGNPACQCGEGELVG